MAAKDVKFGDSARQKMINGVNVFWPMPLK
jgi:hypothetical protein